MTSAIDVRPDPPGSLLNLWLSRPRVCAMAGLASLLFLSLPAGPATAADDVELEGTWFVLIHYTDESTSNPDAKRWKDRVWAFEKSGSRLKWTDYPIVVISDKSGRFEAFKGNPRSRVLEHWTPNDGQLSEILEGPRVNSRGSKTKSLRRSKSGKWATQGRASVRSATTVGYQETWTIDQPTSLPHFEVRDSLGTASSTKDEGGSSFEVTEVVAETGELRGTYERDGIRHGTFRMLKTASVRGLLSSEDERTPNERAAERAMQQMIDEANDLE